MILGQTAATLQVVPFLKNTCISSVRCYPLEVVNLKKMSDEKSNLKDWEEVLPKLDGGKLGYFFERSHSPDQDLENQHGTREGIYIDTRQER